MPSEIFSLPAWLVDCTLEGSVAVVLVAAIGPLVRRFLGAQAAFLLWGIVILRLLVPWLPPTPLQWGTPSVREQLVPRASLISGREITAAVAAEKMEPPAASAASAEASQPRPETETKTPAEGWSWPVAAFMAWLAGLTAILGVSLFRGVRADRLARRARDISDDPLLAGVVDRLGASRVRIKETGELRSPALTGVLRPTILLPLDWRERLTASQLRCVLAHELGHFHRGDLLWRWAFLLARSVHWFNPLVWIAERLFRADQEMACDEWVVLRDPVADPVTYGETLIASAQKRPGQNFGFPVQAGMAESRAGLKRRIRHLASIRPRDWRDFIAGVFLAGALIVLTGPARSEAPEASAGIVEPAFPMAPPSPTPRNTFKVTLGPEPAPTPRSKSPGWGGQVQIESKFVEMPAEMAALVENEAGSADRPIGIRAVYGSKAVQDLLRSLNQKKGVDLMSAPTVTTKSGHPCVVNVIREFRYPDRFEQSADGQGSPTPSAFQTRNLGVTLEAEPTLTPAGEIDLVLAPEVVDFEGFVNYGGTRAAKKNLEGDPMADTYEPSATGVINQPIFYTRRIRTTVTLQDGETAVLGGVTRNDVQTVADKSTGKPPRDIGIQRALFIFVTATSINSEGHPLQGSAPKPPSPPAPVVQADDNFYGIVVPGKPGFVTSPYAPGSGYVDVRGFPINTEVKDPYTGQIFLVPSPDGAAMPDPQPDPATPMGKALRIVIPSLELKDSDLRDAVNTLKNKSVELDSEAEPAKRGVNLVLKLPTQAAASRKITAKLTNISLFEALRFVAATNDLVVVGEPYALSVLPSANGPLTTRKYRVPNPFLSACQATKPSDLKSFWRAHGIDFPSGASVGFNGPNELVLRNSKEEHEKLQKLFAPMPAYPVN